jgi:hypothetical protein
MPSQWSEMKSTAERKVENCTCTTRGGLGAKKFRSGEDSRRPRTATATGGQANPLPLASDRSIDRLRPVAAKASGLKCRDDA